MLALIRSAVDHTATPAAVLAAHGFLAVSLSKIKQSVFVVSDIEHLVTSTWLRLSKRRFLLRAPSRTALDLQRTCGSNATGWKKISEVLHAAIDATPAALPDNCREAIRSSAKIRDPSIHNGFTLLDLCSPCDGMATRKPRVTRRTLGLRLRVSPIF